MDGVWSFLTKIREVVEVVVVVVVVLRTPSAMSVESLVILRGSVAVVVEEAMGGVEALALAVVGVLIMHMDAGQFLTKTFSSTYFKTFYLLLELLVLISTYEMHFCSLGIHLVQEHQPSWKKVSSSKASQCESTSTSPPELQQIPTTVSWLKT